MRLLCIVALPLVACASEIPQAERPPSSTEPESQLSDADCQNAVPVVDTALRAPLERLPRLPALGLAHLAFVEPEEGRALTPEAALGQRVRIAETELASLGPTAKIQVGVDDYRTRSWSKEQVLTLSDLVPIHSTLGTGWHRVVALPVSERGDLLGAPNLEGVLGVAVRHFWIGASGPDSAPPAPRLIYNLPSGTYHMAREGSAGPTRELLLDFWSAPLTAGQRASVFVEIRGTEQHHVTLLDQESGAEPLGPFKLPPLAAGDYVVTLTQGVAFEASACAGQVPGNVGMRALARTSQTITVNRDDTAD